MIRNSTSPKATILAAPPVVATKEKQAGGTAKEAILIPKVAAVPHPKVVREKEHLRPPTDPNKIKKTIDYKNTLN